MSDEIIRLHLASVLKEKRIQRGLSCSDVGDAIGKSNKTIHAWEKGRGQPNADELVKICNLFNIDDINVFFGMKPASWSDDELLLVTHYRSADSRAQWSAKQLLAATQVAPSTQDH